MGAAASLKKLAEKASWFFKRVSQLGFSGCRVAQLGLSACRVLGSKGFSVCRVWGSKGFSVCRAL